MKQLSYKLLAFSFYELNIMTLGFKSFIEENDISKTHAFRLGAMSCGFIDNIFIAKELSSGKPHSEHVQHLNSDYMAKLNDFPGLVDFLIEYLFREFDALDALDESSQYFIMMDNSAPNLALKYGLG